MKEEKEKLSVSIDPDVNETLDKMSINKSKLINKLLREYLDGIKKINQKNKNNRI